MDAALILTCITATILLALLPGADSVFVLTESLANGRKQGIAISFGLYLGVLVHTTATALGISPQFQNSNTAFIVLKIFGAAYLLYLAYMPWKDRDKMTIENSLKNPKLFWKRVKVGFL
ncbi:MAG: threonine/homoserine/homoserine lactone efflux protein [Saprospiraceae bacterium]|jgi:threonine/homoserine/homoserine lactone efflux protein